MSVKKTLIEKKKKEKKKLEFAIFDFSKYKTLVHSAKFLYSSLMRTEQKQIYLLWFTSFTVLCKFYEKSSPQHFFL